MRIMAAAIVLAAAGGIPLNSTAKQPAVDQNAEITVEGATIEMVRDDLVTRCANVGGASTTGSNSVECRKQMEGGKAVFAQLLMGNSYSTTPEAVLHFTLANSGTGVYVSLYQTIETQMAMGQVRQQKLTSRGVLNENQDVLNRMSERVAEQLAKDPVPNPAAAPSTQVTYLCTTDKGESIVSLTPASGCVVQ